MSRARILVAVFAIALCLAGASAQSQTQELHGSGTTNPSKFFWKIMDLLEERARLPIKMTYRAVGGVRCDVIPARSPSPRARPTRPPSVDAIFFPL